MSVVGEERSLSCKGKVSPDGGMVKVYCFPEIGDYPLPRNGGTVRETPLFRSTFAVDSPKGLERKAGDGGKVDLVGMSPVSAEEIEAKAYHQGYSDGREAGMEVARKEVTPKIRDLDEALRELDRIKKEFSQTLEKEALSLALAVAKKVVGYEMQRNANAIVQVIRQALQKVVDDGNIRVRVHPSQIQTIENARSEFADLVPKTETIVLEADQSLTPGGCLIETSFGDIDARLETQFQVIEEAFMAEFQSAHQNG